MKCCNHPEEEAIGACVTCSRPVCEECAVEVEGKREPHLMNVTFMEKKE